MASFGGSTFGIKLDKTPWYVGMTVKQIVDVHHKDLEWQKKHPKKDLDPSSALAMAMDPANF